MNPERKPRRLLRGGGHFKRLQLWRELLHVVDGFSGKDRVKSTANIAQSVDHPSR